MGVRIRVGDKVRVIAGNDKGREGEVARIDWARERAVVKGLALLTRHLKKDPQSGKGGTEEVSGSIHLSNLMPVDPKGEATRVLFKLGKDGKRERYSKKSKGAF